MFSKHILAIACSGVLSLGTMASAIAVEDATGNTPQDTAASGPSDTDTAQGQMASQANQAAGESESQSKPKTAADEAMGKSSPSGQGGAMAQGESTESESGSTRGKVMAGKELRNQKGERIGHVAGVVVGPFGGIQSFVVRTDSAQGDAKSRGSDQGANYVLVPREQVQMQGQQSSRTGSTAQAKGDQQGSQTQGRGTASQQRMLVGMYQLLQQQQREIRLLRQQLAQSALGSQQQQSGMQGDRNAAQSRMGSGSGQAGSASGDPLSQVETVIVDPAGRVQAIVLDSGMMLSPSGGQGMSQAQASSSAARRPHMQSPSRGAAHGKRQQAVILFAPNQQQGSSSDSGGSDDSASGDASPDDMDADQPQQQAATQ